MNTDYDWLIITDDTHDHPYPRNVHVEYCSFEEFRDRVQSHFDFSIALPYPYKICDFRPAFGEIFEDEMRDYRFWGHCDLDQYFGIISDFVTEEVLDSYDKILCLGHFSLFRNDQRINSLYKVKDQSYDQGYTDAFSDSRHWIFDEWPTDKHTSGNRILKQECVRTWLCPECFSDLQPFRSRFQRTLFDYDRENWTDDKVRNEIYVWENGKLFRCYSDNKQLAKQEILYAHIRQRKMDYTLYDDSKSAFVIAPDYFKSSDEFSDPELMKLLRKADFRAMFHPDEIGRKAHLGWGMVKSMIRKVKNVCQKK